MNALKFGSNSDLSVTDDARLSRLEATIISKRGGMTLASTSAYAVPSTTAVLSSGQISPSSGISNTGNAFPSVVQGNFAFVWDNGSLTIYWDASNGSNPFVIRRTDGTQISIPKGSITISGLGASIEYGFAPFISVAQPQRVSFVAGDSGAPRYAFSPSISQQLVISAAQTQQLAANEALTTGLIYFTTGGSGTRTSGLGTNNYRNQPA